MKNKFLVSSIFLLFILVSVNLITAESCSNVGEIDYTLNQYCDIDGTLKTLKADGSSCLNDYECSIGECKEGLCQIKSSIVTSSSLFSDIWDFIRGVQCDSSNQSYICKSGSNHAYLCGSNNLTEDKGQINGVCGYSSNSENNNGGSSGGGGGSSGSSISILIYSPQNKTYNSRTIPLQVGDRYNSAKYWRYSLNNGNKIDFTPNTTITANYGNNLLIVYGRQTQSSTIEISKQVTFIVTQSSSNSCGDNICSLTESCSSCERDCGNCNVPVTACGDNKCDKENESSANCPQDCKPKTNLVYILIIIILIILILIVGFLIIYFINKYRNQNNQIPNVKINNLSS